LLYTVRKADNMTTTTKAKTGTTTNPQVDAAVREKLITARIGLLLKAPFFGNLATRLKLENADEWCPTAATDGRKFYYNSEFINKMPQKQIEFLMGHEVLHCVYDHMGRRGERDPKVWNIADDYCVNQDLLDQKIGERIPVGLYDTKYRGWSAEEVYDDLMKNAKKINIDELSKMLLDEHLDGDDGDGDGEGDGEGKDGDKEGKGGSGDGKKGKRPSLTEEEKKQIRDEIKEAVMAAAQTTAAGNLPAGVRRMIKDLTAPQLDWRSLLQQQIQSTLRTDYTWSRASRKGWDMDAIMPGSDWDKEIDICVSVDASGSMSDSMLRDILSEVKGIMESYTSFRLHLWSFDTEVFNPVVFTAENLDDIMEWSPGGGGGTTFEANWEFMKENDIFPKKFVMFTDGYPGDGWGDENYCDTLFIIHGSTTIEAPFGITAYYELSKETA
jgi:predicted metal-dependent peptidase